MQILEHIGFRNRFYPVFDVVVDEVAEVEELDDADGVNMAPEREDIVDHLVHQVGQTVAGRRFRLGHFPFQSMPPTSCLHIEANLGLVQAYTHTDIERDMT